MSGDEGALAAAWLGLEYALICHYLSAHGQEDIRKFTGLLEHRTAAETPTPKPVVLQPGEIFCYPPGG
jgi:hypothetical protein